MTHWRSETEAYRDRIGDLYEVLNLLTPAFQKLPSPPLSYKPSEIGALKYQLCMLTIGVARSAQELLSSVSLLSVTGNFLAASVCVRSLIELWGVLAYAETNVLGKLGETASVSAASMRLKRLVFGSKSGVARLIGIEEDIPVINVMEFVRAADALSPGAQQTYEFLCDSAHPTFGQHGYLLFSGAEYDNWSNKQFALGAHAILERTAAGAELAIKGVADVGNRIVADCLPQILEEAALT